MGVLGPDPPAPGEQGESWSMLPVVAQVSINRLLFVGANNRRRGSAAEFSELDGQVCYRPSKRGTEDGVRDDGGWAGDTWYRRGAPPRPVVPGPSGLPFLKGKSQRLGLAANHLAGHR
ncbi:hypothetical protein EVAR_19922_1 [Eumeta japonica]|uniref:Uncharacterized protein n=1 Tax=Eumeta variegata TaxID=151549 RepID=A0A4C1ZG07_EUMVA|nr:hypothetical protein EVAR_19922_1 [Eumeta japonica]